MKNISLLISVTAGILSMGYYMLINYAYFSDFGFVETGRIVFASSYGYFDYLLLPLFIVFGLFIYQHRNAGSVTYEKLFEFGWKTSVLSSATFAIFIYLALKFSSPNYFRELVGLIKEMNLSVNETQEV